MSIASKPAPISAPLMPTLALEVLYEDEWFSVINKPENCLSVPGRGADKQDSIIYRAQLHFGEAHAVHRLDYATSGLILVAKTLECHRRLSEHFRERIVEKEYRAVVRGPFFGDHGIIKKPLRCDWPNRPRQQVCKAWGKPAETRWKVLHKESDHFRVQLFPITGRSHQLRVHMQSIGHAIVGDEFYDKDIDNTDERLLLHAYRLEFHHPFTKAWVKFISPCPF
ncbi:RluA family pseudouridine synthase [Marinomonas sp. 2405UD68-3]|uniref:RluA family pseudouridine synthase n=1 Tax=Marinomonas sp. 2405UD68-3 TaxID=3391835 RepID=UPI0039C9D254